MLYCVMDTNNNIIGRFINKDRAINFMIDLYFYGSDELILKKMTEKEYKKLTLNIIKGEIIK